MSMRSRTLLSVAFLGLAFAIAGAAPAWADTVQVVLNSSSVIGGDGSQDRVGYNMGGNSAFNVVDSQTPGVKHETENSDGSLNLATGGRWIASQDTYTAQASHNGWFVLDLGQAYVIDHVDLYNTHNYDWNDRGTGNFAIFASNTVVDAGTGYGYSMGKTLSGETGIISGTLTWSSAYDINAQTFSASTQTAYRYLRFDATVYPFAPLQWWQSPGLNEIMVFAEVETAQAVPLPAPVFVGGALLGLLAVKRRLCSTKV